MQSSVASMIIMTECVVVDEAETVPAAPQMPMM
jgi:hypothetical protein